MLEMEQTVFKTRQIIYLGKFTILGVEFHMGSQGICNMMPVPRYRHSLLTSPTKHPELLRDIFS